MTKRQAKAGNGRVVTNTPNSAKGQSTVTKSAVLRHIATARTVNLSRGVKAHYDNEGTQRLAEAIVKSFRMPTLTEAKLAKKGKDMPKSAQDGAMRREFAVAHKAIAIDISIILGERKGGQITHNRPENNLHMKLAGIAVAMGLPAKTFYPVRSEAVRDGEVPTVYIVRR